jgi:hypothetical protein
MEAQVQIAVVSELAPDVRNRAGSDLRQAKTIRQSLLADDAADGLTFTVNRTQWQSGENATNTPRHRHAFQQIRWAETGRMNYEPDRYIEAGDIGYFPKGAWYGPQVRDEGISITFQFGFNGEKQHGRKFWDQYQEAALANLKARGIFERGLYIDTDPVTGERRERDGVDALYAEQYMMHTGQEFVVPAAGYDASIILHPRAFDYYKASDGVEIKHFGCFFDHPGAEGDIRLGMVRLSRGRFTCPEDRAHVLWSVEPGLVIDGKEYPEHTYVYSPRGESVDLTSTAPVETHLITFPRLD